MRTGMLLVLLVLSGGCGQEKTFNERYENTAGAIENQANAIDQDIENSSTQNGNASASANGPESNRD